MIALLSTLAGFFSAGLPEILKLFREGKDRAHEIALLHMQMQFEREKRHAETEVRTAESLRQLQAIEVRADSVETRALNARVKDSVVGVAWVDALAASVRPVLTYGFCLIYAAVKIAQFHVLMHPALPWQEISVQQALVLLWTQDDVALFTAIIGFWFGQRAIVRSRKVA